MRAKPILTSVLSAFASACASAPREKAYIPQMEEEWVTMSKKGHAEGEGHLIVSIPADETFELWTRMVTFQFIEDTEESPRELMDRILTRLTAQCPDLISNVIKEDEISLTYEWRIDACPAAPDQHEVARLISSPAGIHRVAYVHKGPMMPAAIRAEWIARLDEALVLGRDGQPVHVPESAQTPPDDAPDPEAAPAE